jgi:DNA polymerase-3 subunit gamma/tau
VFFTPTSGKVYVSYLVLARKYRPSGFSSVSGQEHVTRTLANAIQRDRVVHAYLFTGPRGVGKTSVARILSKALNCQKSKDSEPCQECASCKEISSGVSLAVREIDGASHNSVDNVRELIDSFKTLPPPGYRYKVYIIDEVHMLSVSAFNALLKSLEEPPPNTVFILATTEVHKIPETVISRCQRHDFRALSVSVIESRLREVSSHEKLDVEPEALRLVARLADGSMRDAQTLLDRVQSFCVGAITAEETSRALGTVEQRVLLEIAHAIVARDVTKVLSLVEDLFSTGIDSSSLLREFVNFWREIFIAKLGGEGRLRALGVSDDRVVELMRLVSPLEGVDIQDLWDMARDGADRCARSAHPRYGFEALLVRMSTRQSVAEIGETIGRLLNTSESAKPPQGAASGSGQQNTAPSRATKAESSAGIAPSVPPSRSEAASTVVGSSLGWEELLSFMSENAGRVLFENLKRLAVTRLEVGILEGTGPEFPVNSINREKEKLLQILNAFLEKKGLQKPHGWKITLSKGQGAVDATVAEKAKGAAQAEGLGTHPAVQSLQKVFPGSKVEQVRVKSS